jgi:hypothetical protein
VIAGLKEGDRVITAMTGKTADPAAQSNNPFSGARRRF